MLAISGIVLSVPRTQSWNKQTITHLEPPKRLNPEENLAMNGYEKMNVYIRWQTFKSGHCMASTIFAQ